jgi:chloramphenicol 3-O phosphotransferase
VEPLSAPPEDRPGRIVILNGAPRAGKSSIVAALQEGFDGPWVNLGVDLLTAALPPRHRPGIGLRPGGAAERPDLAPLVPRLYAALYEAVAAHARLGLDVVVDVGHHDPGLLADCARRLRGLPVLFVGLFCPLDTIMARRRQGQAGREGLYLTGSADDPVPAPVRAWQQAVHRPGIYDLALDTAAASPAACAARIRQRLAAGPSGPTAFERLAAG